MALRTPLFVHSFTGGFGRRSLSPCEHSCNQPCRTARKTTHPAAVKTHGGSLSQQLSRVDQARWHIRRWFGIRSGLCAQLNWSPIEHEFKIRRAAIGPVRIAPVRYALLDDEGPSSVVFRRENGRVAFSDPRNYALLAVAARPERFSHGPWQKPLFLARRSWAPQYQSMNFGLVLATVLATTTR